MSDTTDQTRRVISGALRGAIHAHGPITKDLVPSATKRVVAQLQSATESGDASELNRLRTGLEKIRDEYDRRLQWEHSTHYPTEAARQWAEGYGTALAHVSLIAFEHLDPAGWAEHEDEQRGAACDNDREWFERTGNCGHCGEPGSYCACPEGDPCTCGPHELATEPLTCRWCKGTGIHRHPRVVG